MYLAGAQVVHELVGQNSGRRTMADWMRAASLGDMLFLLSDILDDVGLEVGRVDDWVVRECFWILTFANLKVGGFRMQ